MGGGEEDFPSDLEARGGGVLVVEGGGKVLGMLGILDTAPVTSSPTFPSPLVAPRVSVKLLEGGVYS